jgi:ribosomal protein S18 acetylase RimI-like enzyme
MSILIREAQDTDWPQIWQIIDPVFRAGETYSYPRDISEGEARQAWMAAPEATYVATDPSGEVVGTYFIKPNQPGQGKHVCNCGYIVGDKARGRGVASQMCRHSQDIALERGFNSMQFNLVVSTNEGAVRLWKELGFEIVGVLPGAFNHPALGFVDAYVMFKKLAGA